MQHRYFGDVGDFGKLGLLRILSGLDDDLKLRLGVVWYLYPDESHNEDGRHVNYLQSNEKVFRGCDETLYDKLRKLLFDDLGIIAENRNLGIAETSNLLPDDTVFYSEPLSYPKNLPASARLLLRQEWTRASLVKTISADIVFLDPVMELSVSLSLEPRKKGRSMSSGTI